MPALNDSADLEFAPDRMQAMGQVVNSRSGLSSNSGGR